MSWTTHAISSCQEAGNERHSYDCEGLGNALWRRWDLILTEKMVGLVTQTSRQKKVSEQARGNQTYWGYV